MHNELYHYGVKGMKWGVRKKYEPVGRSSVTNINKRVKDNDDRNEIAHRNHDRIIEKSKRTGKSAAQIEQEEYSAKKLKLTSKQKKMIVAGGIVAGTALAVYGMRRIRVETDGLGPGLEIDTSPGPKTAASDFFK